MIIQTSNRVRNSKGTKSVIALVIALLLCLPLALAGCSSDSSSSSAPYDPTPKDGQAPYKTEEEIKEELNRKVEEGNLDISIQSIITFDNGTSEGIANIENVPGNNYDIKVRIEDAESKELLYESELLKPNQYVEMIKLDKNLSAGSYPAIATFIAYNPETGNEEGEAGAEITIEVKN